MGRLRIKGELKPGDHALRKALLAMFGGRGHVPKPEHLPHFSARMFKDICDTVKDSDGRPDEISRQDLYEYLVKKSMAGISQRTVDKLLSEMDVDGDGHINAKEFEVVMGRSLRLLAERFDWEDRMNREVPLNHVVPGSSFMNSRSGTHAFAMEVVSQRSMQQMWKVFREVDTNGDHVISLAEFKKYMKKTKPSIAPMATSIFYNLDRHRNNALTFRELMCCIFPEASQADVSILMRMAHPEDHVRAAQPDKELFREIRNVFLIYDDNRNGTLDREEFQHAMALIGFEPSAVDQIFAEVDTDGSGEVTFEEFEQWYITSQNDQLKAMKEAERDSDDESDG